MQDHRKAGAGEPKQKPVPSKVYCTQLELVEFKSKIFFKELCQHLDARGASNLNDKRTRQGGTCQEYVLADKRLRFLELLKLDGPVEIKFITLEDDDMFFAMPFGQLPPSITWKPNGLGWIEVPVQPLDQQDMVLLSNDWWVELRRSFDNKIQNLVQYQLFQTGFLRLLIVPVPSEEVTRALVLTNLPVVLSQVDDKKSSTTEVGMKLLCQCMIFPPAGEFPPTLDDITYGSDEQHSINPPEQFFFMPRLEDEQTPTQMEGEVEDEDKKSSSGFGSMLHRMVGKIFYGHKDDGAITISVPHRLSPQEEEAKCIAPKIFAGPKITRPKCLVGRQPLSKQPLPVLLRQSSNSCEDSYLFPHQKRTVGWMMDIESGVCPQLFCPLANLFGSLYVFSHGVENTMLHKAVDVLRPKQNCLAHGGMIAHPVGSGKTVIAVELVRRTHHMGYTVVCVPDHIVVQWYQELCRFAPEVCVGVYTPDCKLANLDCLVMGHSNVTRVLMYCLNFVYRLIIDEPQDIVKNHAVFDTLVGFQCKQRWLLTATPQPLDLMMQLALGYEYNPVLPFRAMEAWFVQTRCRRDPPTLCLPVPPMHICMRPVTLLWQETAVMHSYAMQDDLQTAIRLASFFHRGKASRGAVIPGLEKAMKFSSLSEWVKQRTSELESQLLKHQTNALRIDQILSEAMKGIGQYQNYKDVVEKKNIKGEEIDPVAMEQLYEQYPGVSEELLLERERCIAAVNQTKQLLTFMESVIDTVTANAECLICMNELGGRVVSMLPCLHSYCAACIATLFRRHKSAVCPLCRKPILRHMVCTFLCATNDEEKMVKEMKNLNITDSSFIQNVRCKFGSKVFAIVAEIVRILGESPTDKIVVFAQWADLLEQISAAIPVGMQHCLLQGSMEIRCRMIEEFQLNPAIKVMLLSSESQASGYLYVFQMYCVI